MTAAVAITMDNLMFSPEQCSNSTTSLKTLGGKIVKGLGGKKTTVTTSLNVAQEESTLQKMAEGQGFTGSILGEVMTSYTTCSLPPSKRYSISATSAHFEELAAEAGIDLDADEINMEDLKMYRLDDDTVYALGDDTDDSVGYTMSDDTTSLNQKLAHKERSILQMVDVLSDRLTSLNEVVINRYNGCKSDLDEATEFRSSRTKKIKGSGADEDWNGSILHKGIDKGRRTIGFHPVAEGGDGNHTAEPARITLRNAPQTDAGRKLAHQFEQEYGLKQVR